MEVMTGFSTDLLEFLKLLKKNNNRDWFNEHKSQFEEIKAHSKVQFNLLFGALKVHDDVDKLKLFRILEM